jgi:hypothetical protein
MNHLLILTLAFFLLNSKLLQPAYENVLNKGIYSKKNMSEAQILEPRAPRSLFGECILYIQQTK